MTRTASDSRKRPTQGRAVDDEDPARSPMDDAPEAEDAGRPPDIAKLEKDRAKSTGGAARPARRPFTP